jgi:hypothetical protein
MHSKRCISISDRANVNGCVSVCDKTAINKVSADGDMVAAASRRFVMMIIIKPKSVSVTPKENAQVPQHRKL